MTTIFLDMDGVVADFDSHCTYILGKRNEDHGWPDEDWAKIRARPRIYGELPKTKEADALVEYCRYLRDTRNYELLFLTAVPKGNDVHWAFYDKVLWAQKYFPDIPVHFGPFAKNKKEHCKPGDILIDDRPSNIIEWGEVDGHGILHSGDLLETLDVLKNLVEDND